jgi:hypothetical protein
MECDWMGAIGVAPPMEIVILVARVPCQSVARLKAFRRATLRLR